ncbi:hypothetical protein C8R42DRAFT_661783 [Lentinula raphanica]|nr:hypothetical protein C8R42DRAFT_661783 [Lentinula raphanica]KAJ3829066.1 hypothetical protein F5880DRAFT_1525751 [Lentinula raphanica]
MRGVKLVSNVGIAVSIPICLFLALCYFPSTFLPGVQSHITTETKGMSQNRVSKARTVEVEMGEAREVLMERRGRPERENSCICSGGAVRSFGAESFILHLLDLDMLFHAI